MLNNPDESGETQKQTEGARLCQIKYLATTDNIKVQLGFVQHSEADLKTESHWIWSEVRFYTRWSSHSSLRDSGTLSGTYPSLQIYCRIGGMFLA